MFSNLQETTAYVARVAVVSREFHPVLVYSTGVSSSLISSLHFCLTLKIALHAAVHKIGARSIDATRSTTLPDCRELLYCVFRVVQFSDCSAVVSA